VVTPSLTTVLCVTGAPLELIVTSSVTVSYPHEVGTTDDVTIPPWQVVYVEGAHGTS
jgi:hypothetical protein